MATDPLPAYARARNALRAHYDAATVHAILDAGLVGHLSFIADGRPMTVPLAYARDGACLYLHGASKTRFVKLCRDAAPLCLSVTILDGIVAARSAFHHSVNYRCAIVHGHARAVEDAAEHDHALQLITEHLLPGRYGEVRPMLPKERKATGVVALEIETASAKIRTGPPVDDEDDLTLGLWSGVVPVVTALGRGIADNHTPEGLPEPASLAAARRKFAE